MQTNPADKLCLQKIRRKLGQNADKSCRQTLSAKSPPKTGPKCRQILQTNLVKTENCRQLQKKCRQSLSSIVRKGLSILDKLCLYPKILELALLVVYRSSELNKSISGLVGLLGLFSRLLSSWGAFPISRPKIFGAKIDSSARLVSF